MNMRLEDCLAFLDLVADADERTVKRAYAARLKKIDQEKDPEGFQKLRHAYEVMLAWVHRSRRDEGKPAPVARSAPPTATADDASHPPAENAMPLAAPPVADRPSHQAHAQEVLRELVAALVPCKGQVDEPKAMLLNCLEDRRLINLDARSEFEYLIGQWLAQGPKPGSLEMFHAAIATFQWVSDRRRLLHFGQVGLVLESVCDEWAIFKALPEVQQARRWDLISRLRARQLPPMDTLMQRNTEVEELLVQMPNWLHTVVGAESARRWLDIVRNYFDIKIDEAESKPAMEPRAGHDESAHRRAGQARPISPWVVPASPTRDRRAWWISGGVVLLVVGVGLALWQFA